jgi:hypothetical protein
VVAVNLTSLISGLVFIALGFVFLLERLSIVDVSAGFVVPVLLIGVGLGVVLGGRRRVTRTEPTPEPPEPETRAEPASE